MSLITPRTLKGFRDLMPAQATRRSELLRTAEDVFRTHGYAPIDTPALEYAEILKGKGGESSDKELYEFQDRGGRHVALRFDLTVPLARYVAEHEGQLVFPFRRYHAGPVWRGERPQKGRYREFWQCDADLVGATGAAADAEILVVFAAVYDALQVGRFQLRVNDRRVLAGLLERLGAAALAVPVLRALDKRDKQGEEAVLAEMEAAGLSAADGASLLETTQRGADQADTLASLADDVRGSAVGEEGVAALARVLELTQAAGVPAEQIRVDPSIARGLDYYTGIVFEVALPDVPGIGSVGSGGRYDDLAGLYTRTKLPGVGGSVGLDRLLAALEERDGAPVDVSPADVMVAHPGASRLETAFSLAAELRRRGLSVEVFPEARKHAQQLRYADRRQIRFVVTPDPDGTLHGKDLVTGDTFGAETADAIHRALEERQR